MNIGTVKRALVAITLILFISVGHSTWAGDRWVTGGLWGSGVGVASGLVMGFSTCHVMIERNPSNLACNRYVPALSAIGLAGVGFGVGALIGKAIDRKSRRAPQEPPAEPAASSSLPSPHIFEIKPVLEN